MALSFIYAFEPAANAPPPMLLLHGTGGDENDLISLGRVVAPGAALLAPRGKVLENGMPRFFRRLREGVFDEADIRRRAKELADFLGEARRAYGLETPIALGFSNGANIAAAVLLLQPEALAGAILIRAMVPLRDSTRAALSGKPVLIISGATDPIAPFANAAELAAILTQAGANVRHEIIPAGHGLVQDNVLISQSFYENLRRAAAP